MIKIKLNCFFICLTAIFCTGGLSSLAATDTLRVMAYNVLNYGSYPLCQGPNGYYNVYLDTIVQFANPDILSMEKMGSIQTSPTDHSYSAAIGFQDSILQYALNAAYPGRYTYCPFTNFAASNTESMVFYDQNKLGFVAITCTYTNTEDFNTYKLFYKDPNLSATHDTTFLYVTVNHDQSGDATTDGVQIGGEMTLIKAHFSHLANMINMGDFNLRSSSEPCYQVLTNPADTNFWYYDPPFYPDASLSYPANWDSNPIPYASYLTTSTRTVNPSLCASSTGGGGKDWFDHIFLSPWIINNANYISYIPHSFRVVGNDGHRVAVQINSGTNTSAPPSVINSLYQMSNKYPVMVDLLVTPNTTGTSLPDPEMVPSSVVNLSLTNDQVTIANPAYGPIAMYFSNSVVGQTVSFECVDMLGRLQMHQTITVDNETMHLQCNLTPGIYYVRITDSNRVLCQTILTRN
jgi:hypothetical protein